MNGSNFFDYAGLGVGQADAPTVDDIEAGAGRRRPASIGIHHAILQSATPPGDLDAWKFKFTIVAGPDNGKSVEFVAWPPRDEGDPERLAKARQKIQLFYLRLGFLQKDPATARAIPVPGKSSPIDCIGTPCFINVTEHKPRTYDGKHGPVTITEAKLGWEGLLKPDDKATANVQRATDAVLAAAIAGVKAAAAGPSQAAANRYAELT